MKKMLSLLTALCLVCLCASAFADVTASSPLTLDGFTLNLDAGIKYDLGTKTAQQVYITVYPYSAAGDTATNFNFVWAGTTQTITAADVKAELPGLRQQMIDGLQGYGYTVDSLDYDDPSDGTISGEACIVSNAKLVMSAYGQSMTLYQRQLYVGSKGFVITISAADTATLDAVTALLNSTLAWN